MNFNKSHFSYSKSQRSGIYLLIVFVVLLQIVLNSYQFSPREHDVKDIGYIKKQLDSLKQASQYKYKPKPFQAPSKVEEPSDPIDAYFASMQRKNPVYARERPNPEAKIK